MCEEQLRVVIDAHDFWIKFAEYYKLKKDITEDIYFLVAEKKSNKLKIIDWIFLKDQFGIEVTVNYVKIPAKISLAFIKLCKKNDFYPIILHTHKWLGSNKNISFSMEDLLYMKKFVKTCRKLKFNSAVIFWVTNGKFYQQCIFENEIDKEGIFLETLAI